MDNLLALLTALGGLAGLAGLVSALASARNAVKQSDLQALRGTIAPQKTTKKPPAGSATCKRFLSRSGREDLNLRLLGPKLYREKPLPEFT